MSASVVICVCIKFQVRRLCLNAVKWIRTWYFADMNNGLKFNDGKDNSNKSQGCLEDWQREFRKWIYFTTLWGLTDVYTEYCFHFPVLIFTLIRYSNKISYEISLTFYVPSTLISSYASQWKPEVSSLIKFHL